MRNYRSRDQRRHLLDLLCWNPQKEVLWAEIDRSLVIYLKNIAVFVLWDSSGETRISLTTRREERDLPPCLSPGIIVVTIFRLNARAPRVGSRVSPLRGSACQQTPHHGHLGRDRARFSARSDPAVSHQRLRLDATSIPQHPQLKNIGIAFAIPIPS